VITNLLSNALKFTPPGGRVAISTRQDYPDAVLEVTDTGSGIPPTSYRTSSTGSGAVGKRPRPPAGHRPVGRGRPGQRARRPADRSQPARARHHHDAHPARRLTSGRRPSAATLTRPLVTAIPETRSISRSIAVTSY
jgi:hypothetical protein